MNPVRPSDASAALLQSPLSERIPKRELDQVAARFARREFPAGAALFRQGEPALVYYLIGEGQVKGVQADPEGVEVITHILGAGSLLGALPTLGGGAYPSSAIALTPVTVFAVAAHDFEQALRDHPQLAINLLKLAAGMLREMQRRLTDAVTLRVEQRIARTLRRLARDCGRDCGDGIVLDVPLTRRDLAELSATTQYTVSRTLKAWERQGWVRVGRRSLVLLDDAALERWAQE